MPSQFERHFQSRGVNALNRQHAVEIVYSREGVETQPMTARRSDRTYSTVGGKFKSMQMVMMRDYVLQASSLTLSGNDFTPRTGDKITEGDEVFEVSPVSELQPCGELQSGGYEWLVHTKRVDFQTQTGRGYRGES